MGATKGFQDLTPFSLKERHRQSMLSQVVVQATGLLWHIMLGGVEIFLVCLSFLLFSEMRKFV